MITRRVLAFALSLAVLPWATPASARERLPGPCPQVAGHRAGPPVAPENSLPGIEAVAGTGAPLVEMDVRWSYGEGTAAKPGYPVLMHDTTVQRTTNGTGDVSGMGLTALTDLLAQDYAPYKTNPAFDDVHVPWAWEFLDRAHSTGLTALLDVKTTPNQYAAAKLYQYIVSTEMTGRVIYMGSAASVKAMHGWYPNLTYIFIEYPPSGRVATNPYLTSIGADGYAIPWHHIKPEDRAALVAYYHAGNHRFATWTTDDLPTSVDTPANWTAAANARVDILISNKPADAVSLMEGLCP